MESFELDALVKEHASLGKLYLEFLRVPSLSMGLYVLPAGGTDPQTPHTEDEVYYIVSGEAVISVGAEEHKWRRGGLENVTAKCRHRFQQFGSNIGVRYFLAPADI